MEATSSALATLALILMALRPNDVQLQQFLSAPFLATAIVYLQHQHQIVLD